MRLYVTFTSPYALHLRPSFNAEDDPVVTHGRHRVRMSRIGTKCGSRHVRCTPLLEDKRKPAEIA
jgi:hypothetical protein